MVVVTTGRGRFIQPKEAEEMQSCRSPEGMVVGLVDAIIGIVRYLAVADLTTLPVQEALADLFEDPDFRKIQDARRE
ncbi:hypothetical protein ABZX40_13710 [Streptomyces sp. NPDC004610]|uniref:hypothetical protein n=1 Tax=unclassified Streptomyces TaxID=2593676 RepID=UPI0033AE630A